MRNSTDRIDSREPLAGGKRQREGSELPSEHLPERKRFPVGADGDLTVIKEEDIRPEGPYPMSARRRSVNRSGTAQDDSSGPSSLA